MARRREMKMSRNPCQLTEPELLLAVDGELSPRRTVEVQEHLTACRACRSRMAELEAKIAKVTQACLPRSDEAIPPIDGARAVLKSRLAELAVRSTVSPRLRLPKILFADRRVAVLGISLLIVLIFGQGVSRLMPSHPSKIESMPTDLGPTPDQRLTPGATRKVSIKEICSTPHEEVIRAVPATVRQEIFHEYGIVNASTNDYEIDYLIAPGLGGADDIHNLWPEPYTTTIWDARVKDGLEQRLHQLVCSGQLDLTTAQNDIASNWIAAYKKYLHSDKPSRYATP